MPLDALTVFFYALTLSIYCILRSFEGSSDLDDGEDDIDSEDDDLSPQEGGAAGGGVPLGVPGEARAPPRKAPRGVRPSNAQSGSNGRQVP